MIMFIKFSYGNVATSSKGYVESVQVAKRHKVGNLYLKEAGWADGGHVIACTQPRRLAAQISVHLCDKMAGHACEVQDGFVPFTAIDKHQKCFIVRSRLH
ncbi:hypothetical protein Tco_0232023 [Tanacetum coccineum]